MSNLTVNSLAAEQVRLAKKEYLKDREQAYLTQIAPTAPGKDKIQKLKYMGENGFVPLPGVAVKGVTPEDGLMGSLNKYFKTIEETKHIPNKTLVRTHTHPTIFEGADVSDLAKPPSHPDMLNAASIYALPQNRNLKNNLNQVYTKENNRDVVYTYDIPPTLRESIQKHGNLAYIPWSVQHNLKNGVMDLVDSGRAGIDSITQGKPYMRAFIEHTNRNRFENYQKMGYPVSRKEL